MSLQDVIRFSSQPVIVIPASSTSHPFDLLTLAFGTAVPEGALQPGDLSLTGPQGEISPHKMVRLSENRYQADFRGLTGPGVYHLTLRMGFQTMASTSQSAVQSTRLDTGLCQASLITGGAVIGEDSRDFEGQNIILYGGKSTLSGMHHFASLILMAGAVLKQDQLSIDLTDLTISGGSTYTLSGGDTLNITNGLAIIGNSTLLVQGTNNTGQVGGVWAGAGGTINAGNVIIQTGSKISADGQGYTGLLNAKGNGPGGGITAYTGGSYGGLGGSSNNNPASGVTYGSAPQPVDLGSAGGGGAFYQGTGGNGGGAIRLSVTGTLTLNGVIRANGVTGANNGGGGAGGSIWVTTATLTGMDHVGNQQAFNPQAQAFTQVPKGLVYLPILRR